MNSTNSFRISNSPAPSTTESVISCIDNTYCPPESVYYAGEYIRLEGEIENWKTKATQLESELKRNRFESNLEQIKAVKEIELRLQEHFNLERTKLVDFYQSEINSLREQNKELASKNSEHSKNIKLSNELLLIANQNFTQLKNENSVLKANLEEKVVRVNELTISHSKLQNQQKSLADKENEFFKKKQTNVFTGKDSNNRLENRSLSPFIKKINNADKSVLLPNFEIQTESPDTIYQPLCSPITPMEVEGQDQINREAPNENITVTNSVIEIASTIATVPFLGSNEHYEVYATLAQDIDLQIYMCACGSKYSCRQSLQHHISRAKNVQVYRCQTCYNSFRSKGTLKAHCKKIHGVKCQQGNHGCGKCAQTFASSKLLRQHKNVEHGRKHTFVKKRS